MLSDLMLDDDGLICKRCKKEVDDELYCFNCMRGVHYKCDEISEKTYKSMSGSRKRKWKCWKCKSEANTSMKANTSEVESESKDFNIKDQFVLLNNKMDKIGGEMVDIKKAISFLSEKYDSLLEELNDMKELKKSLMEKDKLISNMRSKIYEIEQENLVNNIEIVGLKVNEDNDMVGSVIKLCNEIGVKDCNKNDIVDIFKLENKVKKTSKVIVKFRNRMIKKEVLSCKKKLVGKKDLYINENLTRYYADLLWKTKQKCREYNFKFCWIKDGKILVRKDTENISFRIASEDDLGKII